MRKSLSLLLIPALALGACAHRQARSAADEFDVVRNAPLVIPPDFTLAPPPAGTVTNGPEISRHQLPSERIAGTFDDTMLMSTYLVAVIVGRLEAT